MVACSPFQHSPMLGQRASWQTVFRPRLRVRPFRRLCASPPGSGTLSQAGLRRGSAARDPAPPAALAWTLSAAGAPGTFSACCPPHSASPGAPSAGAPALSGGAASAWGSCGVSMGGEGPTRIANAPEPAARPTHPRPQAAGASARARGAGRHCSWDWDPNDGGGSGFRRGRSSAAASGTALVNTADEAYLITTSMFRLPAAIRSTRAKAWYSSVSTRRALEAIAA
jgi:hypothetical protein